MAIKGLRCTILMQILYILGVKGVSLPYLSRCSTKLESALDTMMRKSNGRSEFKSFIDMSSYTLYRPPKMNDKIDYNTNNRYNGGGGDEDSGEKVLPISSVEVSELRARLPTHQRWIHVDKCQFIPKNRTLETRLLFPDLTISGKVLMQPGGGQCTMILRLRHAGIEFRTVPIEEHKYAEGATSRTASVRTDSHFAEPGFLSVFAHNCQGPTGVKVRQNSKRRHFGVGDRNARDYMRRRDDFAEHKQTYHGRNMRYDDVEDGGAHYGNDDAMDGIYFSDEVLDSGRTKQLRDDDDDVGGGYARAFGLKGSNWNSATKPNRFANQWHNIELANSEEMADAYSRDLEELFAKGVRGLLTTYMQKTLQPAIKETLMESMGYTLSYGK